MGNLFPKGSQGDNDQLPNAWADNNCCESSAGREFTSGQSGQDSIQRNRAFKKGIESVQGRPENDIPGKNQQMKGIGGAIKEQKVQSEKGKVRSDFRRP